MIWTNWCLNSCITQQVRPPVKIFLKFRVSGNFCTIYTDFPGCFFAFSGNFYTIIPLSCQCQCTQQVRPSGTTALTPCGAELGLTDHRVTLRCSMSPRYCGPSIASSQHRWVLRSGNNYLLRGDRRWGVWDSLEHGLLYSYTYKYRSPCLEDLKAGLHGWFFNQSKKSDADNLIVIKRSTVYCHMLWVHLAHLKSFDLFVSP